jgi:crossover junction endodeoxyribonuclease RuvC
MRVLGIDPGLRRTGFGVIDTDGPRLRYVASGTIVVPPALTLSERLKVILDNLRQVARDTQPDVAALEIVFLNTNPASTLLLGQAPWPTVRWPCTSTPRCRSRKPWSAPAAPPRSRCR